MMSLVTSTMKQRTPTRSLLTFLSKIEPTISSPSVKLTEPMEKVSSVRGVLFTLSLPNTVALMIDTVTSDQPDRVGLFLQSEGFKRLLGYTNIADVTKLLSSPPQTLSIDIVQSYLPKIRFDAACEILAALALGTRRQTRLSTLDNK